MVACRYLSFVQGIVDSDTLPLQVSRESLQQHDSLKTIKKKLVRKALDMIKKLADAETAFAAEDADSESLVQSHCTSMHLLRILFCIYSRTCLTFAIICLLQHPVCRWLCFCLHRDHRCSPSGCVFCIFLLYLWNHC